MAPRKSPKKSTPEIVLGEARGGSVHAARQRLPPNIQWEKLTPERQKNCERAFTAASRRSDRDIDARYQSALTASDMHFLRTGKYLKVTREMVMNEEMYEEEDSHPRLWTANLRQDSDPRIAALNQQYTSIDMQFQAAFPGLARTPSASMSPTVPMTMSPTAPSPTADALTYYPQQTAQLDLMQYCMAQFVPGFAPQRFAPVNYETSNGSTPPSLTDSGGASPHIPTSPPSSPHTTVPNIMSAASSPVMGSVAYTGAKFVPTTSTAPIFVDEPLYDDGIAIGAAGAPTIWGVPEDFSEFVKYEVV